MIRIILLLFSMLLMINCNKNETMEVNNIKTIKSDSLMTVIDSIQLANLHKGFVGIHNHGLITGAVDLAEHAHQNPKKKRRWRKKQALGIAAKMRAVKKRNLERQNPSFNQ